jgi:quercetin dioxygenase-like cupin family protein
MRSRAIWTVLFVVVIAGVMAYVRNVTATPASGFVSTTVALGRFGNIDVSNYQVTESSNPKRRRPDIWLSWQKSKGPSDLYVQSNIWSPGGSSGWHTHPGHSLITVTAGTLTVYDGDDPSCTPRQYTAGMGFVDPGGDHLHLVRNEDSVEARSMTVQLIPAGATRRIDADAPGGCSFLQ